MNIFHQSTDPLVVYARALLAAHAERLREARKHGERGASAVEWAIITGISVVLIAAILIVVRIAVGNGESHIQTTVTP